MGMLDLVLASSGCYNKNHRLGGLNNINVLPHGSEGGKSKIKVSIELF